MRKTFVLLLAAMFCLSCAHARKIPPAAATWGSDGSGTIVAPANQMGSIVNGLNELPLECVEHAEKLLAAANPGPNTIMEITCSIGKFLLRVQPAPRDMEVSIENRFPLKAIMVVLYNKEGGRVWSSIASGIAPRSAAVTKLKAGNYIAETYFVGEPGSKQNWPIEITDVDYRKYSKYAHQAVDHVIWWPFEAE